ncbi:unnamed protein product [Leptosia nina]|uniref:C2H2-type domain-containing protein n=1 Tax=Leptosia nina TaxID=320188 RepID=A0AAV1JHV7_9NEOP
MDSDIDIEEHNLLDNPALRAIFPDITVLKQEIFEINNEDDQNFQDENPNIGVEGCALYSNESNNLASKSLKLPDKICSVVPKTFGDRTKKDSNKNLDVEPPRVSELPAIPNKQQENLVVNSIPKQTTDKHVMKNIKENTLVQKSKRKETSLFFKCFSHLTSDSTVQATSAIQVPDTSQKIFYFEPKHYGSNNQFWLQHIFNGLPMADIDKILSNAIYKYESRIKLQVSKNGIPEYTEYQCETCHCFVDCLSLFKHINACTRKIKKYSCKFCARRFDSEDASTKHLKLHESSLDPETCRIVSFNRKIDKKINDLIKANPSRPYVVYQCRNCEGLINRSNFSSHICTYTDLENCNVCGLLLYKSHFADHLRKHKELQSFTVNNMKVVLLGLRTPSTNKTKVSSFMGIVCDYIFYRCSKCNVCIKEFRCIAKHFCLIETCKAQCHKCDLYFDEGKLKGHIKLHADDLDFVKDNITLIDFNPKENTNEDDVVTLPKMSNEQSTLVDGDDVEIVDDKAIQTVEEKTATLYKCAKCKLHFLNKNSVDDHIRKKPARITKQFCTKCGFSFSPNTLFHHLLEHHGQRDVKYTFQVEDVFGTFKKQKVYKCIKCNLHFTNLKKANEHHSKCSGDSSQGEKCKCCGLMFHFSYLLNHERNSENNSHTDYEVVEAEGE